MKRDKSERLPQTLFEIGKVVSSSDDLEAKLTRISELVCDLAAADTCSVMLFSSNDDLLVGKASHGVNDVGNISFRIGEGVAGWVGKHGESVLLDDVTKDSRFVSLPGGDRRRSDDKRPSIRAMACVPMLARDRAVGVLTATSATLGAFSEPDIEILNFVAKTIALDIENLRLRRACVTDQLTGAFNREFLNQRLSAEVDRANRRGDDLSLAMVDVDHFKPINDQYGHGVGDIVLAGVAEKLKRAIRTDDMLIRYGGEEFLVLLPSTNAVRAREVGERMRLSLQDEVFRTTQADINVRISVGIAQHLPGKDDPASLIRRADDALYAAKEGGRNRVEVAS
jgi:diguanylate cyclase (GGDEF)-like protein